MRLSGSAVWAATGVATSTAMITESNDLTIEVFMEIPPLGPMARPHSVRPAYPTGLDGPKVFLVPVAEPSATRVWWSKIIRRGAR